uniref:Uncharacterized protein n=1 Tax=Trypanosoma vivax (strain Y486) TaxID=1055687 RepID=G0TZB8_TRYVY|nr:hypothetical protein, unlikely [Trypanosoma vivax Y486]
MCLDSVAYEDAFGFREQRTPKRIGIRGRTRCLPMKGHTHQPAFRCRDPFVTVGCGGGRGCTRVHQCVRCRDTIPPEHAPCSFFALSAPADRGIYQVNSTTNVVGTSVTFTACPHEALPSTFTQWVTQWSLSMPS